MSGKKPRNPARFLNGILGLGLLIVLGSLAGLTATAVTGSSGSMEAADSVVLSGSEATSGDTARSDSVSRLRPRRIEGKYGYVDAFGKIVIAPRFDAADTFSEGLALVLEKGRFGYIDTRGIFAIPAVFRHARPFQDGFATVRFGNDWLFIDRAGHSVAARDDTAD